MNAIPKDHLTSTDADVISWLLALPLLERRELEVLAEWSHASISRSVGRLERMGAVASVRASVPGAPTVRRLYLTSAGISIAAGLKGTTPDTLLHRHPVSAHWIRLLLARLDGVSTIYRLTAAVAGAAGIRGFRWYRKLPLDALIELEGGRLLGVIREGRFAPPSHLGRRLRSLVHGRHPDSLVVVAADPLRLRDWKSLLRQFPLSAFLVLEQDLLAGAEASPVWHVPSDPDPWPLGRVIGLAKGGMVPTERPPARTAPPPANPATAVQQLPTGGTGGRTEDCFLPVALDAGNKRLLEMLALWPWMCLSDLHDLMGVSSARALQFLDLPLRLRLVTRVRHDGRIRYLLANRGLGYLARRDRVAFPAMLRRWSPSPRSPDEPFSWRNVRGSRARQLARDIVHTAAVHHFLAAVAAQARESGGRLVQAEPPHRAVRRFQVDGMYMSINPDAYAQIEHGGRVHHFFLEWERRAAHPALLRERIAPYLRYFGSRRPLDDDGAYPVLMVVLRDEIVESHFLRLACDELGKTSTAPLRVLASNAQAVEAQGALGHVWRERPGGKQNPPLP